MLTRLRLPPTVHDGSHYRLWQRRFHPFNAFSEKKRQEKLNYMHSNPVKRGLVLRDVIGRYIVWKGGASAPPHTRANLAALAAEATWLPGLKAAWNPLPSAAGLKPRPSGPTF